MFLKSNLKYIIVLFNKKKKKKNSFFTNIKMYILFI